MPKKSARSAWSNPTHAPLAHETGVLPRREEAREL